MELIIKNATIVDGTGSQAYKADVGVAGDRVVRIENNITEEAELVIDGEGMCLSPGFIDPHTHSDMALIINPLAESKIYQGVTTEVVGNCGSSPVPLLGASLEETQAEAKVYGLEIDWTDMAGYLTRIRRQGIALNLVPLVGHNTVRGAVMGYGDVQPDKHQQAAIEKLVQEAMEQGGHGLSTGLYYPPGFYAKTKEVIGLARAAGKMGGVYASHIRSESDTLFEAVDEAIEIGKKAEIPVQISHLKLEGEHNFSGADRLLEKIDQANDASQVVNCDQYPYAASSTWLGACLPNWAQAGGGKTIADRLKDPDIRKVLKEDYQHNRLDWDNRSGITRWDQVLLTEVEGRHEIEGKTVEEVAEIDKTDPLDTLFNLIILTNAGASAVYFDQLEENVQRLMQHERVMISSDGSSLSPEGVLGRGNPHPRNYGTFPRVLGCYVRELGALTLEQAVHKMTGQTAQAFKLANRGEIKIGAFADLVLFDANKVIDKATFNQPKQFPAGIPWVIVNGRVVVANGKHTGALPGKAL